MRDLVEMLNQVHTGKFVPAASRDRVFPPPSSRRSIHRAFLDETGLMVMDAARVLQEDGWFATQDAMDEADDRLRRLRADDSFPQVGMVELDEAEDADAGQEVVAEVVESSSSDTDASTNSTDESECELHHAYIGVYHEQGSRAMPSEKSDTMKVYRHSRTKMLHYAHVEHSDRTGCGRSISEAYYVYSADPDVAFPKCKVCFGSVQV